MRQTSSGASPTTNGGFEAKLWQTADALRNNMDAAEYKHVVLGLIFLKYISDAFEAKHAELEAELETDRAAGVDPEDPDEYRAVSIFWVPREARWQPLKASAPESEYERFSSHRATLPSLVEQDFDESVQAVKAIEIRRAPQAKRSRKA